MGFEQAVSSLFREGLYPFGLVNPPPENRARNSLNRLVNFPLRWSREPGMGVQFIASILTNPLKSTIN